MPTNGTDRSSFVTDANGTASFIGLIAKPLLDAAQLVLSVIYHADRVSYGSLPNRGEYVTQGPACAARTARTPCGSY